MKYLVQSGALTLIGRDQIARIDHQSLNSHTSNPRSNIQIPRQRTNGPEEGIHCHRQKPQDQDADEELRCRALEIRHEVDDDVEN